MINMKKLILLVLLIPILAYGNKNDDELIAMGVNHSGYSSYHHQILYTKCLNIYGAGVCNESVSFTISDQQFKDLVHNRWARTP